MALATLVALMVVGSPRAHADTDTQSTAQSIAEPPQAHGAMSIGWLTAVTGPLGFGFAGDVEFFPRGQVFGGGLYYRSNFAGDTGMVTAGLTFAAGATRPKMVITLHADVGLTYGPSKPAFGGGVRTELGVVGPLAVASNVTGYLVYDGIDSRLALAVTWTAGISR